MAFAASTLRGEELSDEEAAQARPLWGVALMAEGVAFFLAGLGDKLLAATTTVPASRYPIRINKELS